VSRKRCRPHIHRPRQYHGADRSIASVDTNEQAVRMYSYRNNAEFSVERDVKRTGIRERPPDRFSKLMPRNDRDLQSREFVGKELCQRLLLQYTATCLYAPSFVLDQLVRRLNGAAIMRAAKAWIMAAPFAAYFSSLGILNSSVLSLIRPKVIKRA
jgi:hypothetical protein